MEKSNGVRSGDLVGQVPRRDAANHVPIFKGCKGTSRKLRGLTVDHVQ
jgi:hypothetical protein